MSNASIPRLPFFAVELLRRLPLPLLDRVIGRLVEGTVGRHPSLFARLGNHAATTFLIDPIDLPFALLLFPARTGRRMEFTRRDKSGGWDARIAGPLAALIGLVHGAYDGDALFFSRDVTIEGKTEAVLALRNAIDDAEIDLSGEVLAMLGVLRAVAERPFRFLLPFAEKASGVCLARNNAGQANG
jgi:O2-independent ubiquinone biosynthesis accessory factor UbiT